MRRFATFRSIAEPSREQLAESLQKIGEQLTGTKERGTVQLRVLGTTGRDETWTVDLGDAGVSVSKTATEKPVLEIVTRGETWSRIVSGAISPIDAFVTGKVRVRGDTELAKRLVLHLAGGEGDVNPCE